MKERNRILALVLSVIMIFTFMPAMAFAEDELQTEEADVTGSVQEEKPEEEPVISEDAVASENAEVSEDAPESEMTEAAGETLQTQKEASVQGQGHFNDFEGGEGDVPVTYINKDGIQQTAYRTTDGFAYTLVNSDGFDSVRIIGYNGGGTTINVPAKINGHVVSGFSIDPREPFDGENYDSIKAIKIPDSMIYLRTRNLKYFKALESVSGNNGDIDNDAYMTADGVLYKKYDSGLKAFYPQAKASTSWTMAAGCNKSIDFPKDCPLETLTLSAEFDKLWAISGSELPNLQAYIAPEDSKEFKSVNGALYSKDGTVFYKYPANKDSASYRVADGVTEIYDSAFLGAKKLGSIILPSSLISIDEFAFEQCSKLKTITIPENVKGIGYGAFDGCTALTKIIFTAKVAPPATDAKEKFSGLRNVVMGMDVAIEYPASGEGYEEFIAVFKDFGQLAPVPDDPVVLDLEKLTEVTIAPGEVKTFEITADVAYQYGLGVWSSDSKKIDYCSFDKGSLYPYTYIYKGQTTYQYNEMYAYPAVFMNAMLPGEAKYVQIKSDESNTTSDFKVKAIRYHPIGIVDISDNCEELIPDVTKNANIQSVDDVVMYKFTTGDLPEITVEDDESDDEDDERHLVYQFSATRAKNGTDEYGNPVYWNSALLYKGSKYSMFPLYGTEDSAASTQWLEPNTTYYLQIQPRVVGELSVTMTQLENSSYSTVEDSFAEVPDGDIESISVGDEKEVQISGDSEEETCTFEFIPVVTGDYTFQSVGGSDTDTIGRVLDAQENVISFSDDSDISGRLDFAVCFHAEAGQKYYLQAKLYDNEEAAVFTVKLNEYIGEHKHILEHIDAIAGNKSTEGTKGYYRCTVCGNMYADRECKHRLYKDDLAVEYGWLVMGVEFVPAEGVNLSADAGKKIGKSLGDMNGFFTAGNKIIITYDDSSKDEYICVENSPGEGEDTYFGYYLNGDTEEAELTSYLKAIVLNDSKKLVNGDNSVALSIWRDKQYSECIINVKGVGAHDHVAGEPVKENEKAATCEESGSYDNVVYCKECGEVISRETVTVPALGHNYKFNKFEWAKAGDTYTAKAVYVCLNNAEHVEKHDAAVKSETTDPACEVNGQIVYTATYEGNTDVHTETIEKLGHDWGEATYTWDAGYTQLTASHTCQRTNCNKVESETVGVAEETVSVQPTLRNAGRKTVKSEDFKNKAFESKTVTDIEVPAIKDEYAEDAEASKEAVDTAVALIEGEKTDEEIAGQEAAVSEAEIKAQATAEKANAVAEEADSALAAAQEAYDADPSEANKTVLDEAKNMAAAAQRFKAAANTSLSKAKAASAKVAAAKASVANRKIQEGATDPVTMAELDAAQADANRLASETAVASENAKAAAESFKELANDDATDADITGSTEEIEDVIAGANNTTQDVDAANESKDAANAGALDGKKSEAKAQLDNYKNPAAYRAAQRTELANAIAAGKNAIDAATDEAGIATALANAKAVMDGIKTDAQMSAEEQAAAQAAPPAPTEITDLPTVKISKPAAAKKKITVKWKKVSKKNLKKISGIQIQVATDPGFTNIVKVTTAGKKKTSKVIKGLQPKTKYYVRIRAYAPGNHYSVWKSKSAKVK